MAYTAAILDNSGISQNCQKKACIKFQPSVNFLEVKWQWLELMLFKYELNSAVVGIKLHLSKDRQYFLCNVKNNWNTSTPKEMSKRLSIQFSSK